jgi:hypothetical protein
MDPPVDPSVKNNLAIRLASEHGHLPIVERLLQDRRVDPSADNDEALVMASYSGHTQVVERLIQDHRMYRFNNAIISASQRHNFDIVEMLATYQEKYYVDEDTERALMMAQESGSNIDCELYIDNKENSLHTAVWLRALAVVKSILDLTVEVHPFWGLFNEALGDGDLEILELMLPYFRKDYKLDR